MSTNLYKPGRYAAIDIGTVTSRLFVADVDETGAIQGAARDIAITNLGTGVDASGRLAADAIERVGSKVDEFAAVISRLEKDGRSVMVRAIATSAARDAANSDELVERLRRAGVELTIIPGEREASLSFAGATSAFPGEKAVVIDVGGGSTEIIAGMAGGALEHAHSFQIGCRRVTERFFTQDPPGEALVGKAATWIADEMADYLGVLGEEGFFDGRVIAVAGTATSIVSMREEMEVYDSSRVHGAVVTRGDIDALISKLKDMPLADRQRIVGLNPQRAPVILAGVVILQQVMDVAGINEFTVSESDILQGVVLAEASR
ncbi:MAG: Ppx/GppA family phosphatase [Eggerthellaceae bacterium]|nr:Ppx/GppA family phosphatase [Eggerthellaceae bacterium]